MKYILLSLVLSTAPAAFAKNSTQSILVSCQIQNFANCTNCQERVPAACMGKEAVGSLPLSIKPSKLEWQVSNSKNGSEQRFTVENKTFTLKDIKTAKNLKTLATKHKVKVGAGETVSLLSIQIPMQTKLYKSHQGTETIAEMKPKSAGRSIASADDNSSQPIPVKGTVAGGVKRAQQYLQKK